MEGLNGKAAETDGTESGEGKPAWVSAGHVTKEVYK